MKLTWATALGTALLAAAPALADKGTVLDTYANIALAKYEDSLTTAEALKVAVNALVATPSAEALQSAKEASLQSRIPYQQTEVYRFGNANVDDWEGKVNAWPLDEGLIDYIDSTYGWATDEVDYAMGDAGTGGNCDRRGDYLMAATALLASDLEWTVTQCQDGGNARAQLTTDQKAGISAVLTGMGSLSYGEQAGERMKLCVLLNDPEEEHDCFSDNTRNSHFYDAMGIRNVYIGSYTGIDGSVVSGASLSSLVAQVDAGVDTELTTKLNATMLEMAGMKTAAEAGFAYDMMLERGNDAGEALIKGDLNALVDQTRSIKRAVTALGVDKIALEGSDSLDDPNAVFQ